MMHSQVYIPSAQGRLSGITYRPDQLSILFNSLAEGVMVFDVQGRVTQANPRVAEMLGANPVGKIQDELVSIYSIRYLDGKGVPMEALPSQRALSGEIVQNERYQIRNARDQEFYILSSATPLYQQGEQWGAVLVWNDITEREKLMEQLETEKALLHTVISHMPGGLVVLDEQGQVILTNPAAQQFADHGYNADDDHLSGTGDADQDTCRYEPLALPLSRSVTHRESQVNLEIAVDKGDEQHCDFLLNAVPILNQKGVVRGAVGIFQDITERKQAERKIREDAKRAELQASLSHAMMEAGLDSSRISFTIVQKISELYGDACIIRLLSEDGSLLDPVDYAHPEGQAIEDIRKVLSVKTDSAGEGLAGKVAQSQEPIYLPNTSSEELIQLMPERYADWLKKYQIYSLIIVPMKAHGELAGTLALLRPYENQPYTPEDLAFFQDLAGRAGLAMMNARLHQEIRRLATLDSLTGVYNRRAFLELGEHEMERFLRLGRPLSAMMIDIDLFKHINDTYGHAAGDQALKVVAQICKRNIRSMDILGRYGGDEFVILLPETDRFEGMEIGYRIIRELQQQLINRVALPFRVSLSIGLAQAPQHLGDLADLLSRADRAMYTAKRKGGGQVSMTNKR